MTGDKPRPLSRAGEPGLPGARDQLMASGITFRFTDNNEHPPLSPRHLGEGEANDERFLLSRLAA